MFCAVTKIRETGVLVLEEDICCVGYMSHCDGAIYIDVDWYNRTGIKRVVSEIAGPSTPGSYGASFTTTCGLWHIHERPGPGDVDSGLDAGRTAGSVAGTGSGSSSSSPGAWPWWSVHMERFKRMAPPSFKGESQPLLAESWMREVEKIFRAIRCAEEDKVSLATYILQVLRVYVLR
ncbi:hypothetical protein Taro_041021 [Colocasia esculenta]|uniref:Uncharacterized protein n=1 Tax=Colocasia esculenta TaxID=4460 RepID=A0A843WKE3_COLES|nr:hypothetical protein [Colocasia esculenta]